MLHGNPRLGACSFLFVLDGIVAIDTLCSRAASFAGSR
jgi:hypothetical protein